MALQVTLPALTQLPPPVGPTSPPAAGVDLDVDYEAEIRPNLGRCIVRISLAMGYNTHLARCLNWSREHRATTAM